ncbi:ABC transporter permease [Ekhidna sp.]
MFKNNFKIGLRNLYKRKGFTAINTFGLAIGLTSCILIGLYLQNEFSYDKSFEDGDRIYRMLEEQTVNGDTEINNRIPYSFVGIVPRDYPEVDGATAVAGPFESQTVGIVDEKGQKTSFLEDNVLIADSSFFAVFSFEMLRGDRNSALKNPNSVVLSKSTAKRFFGEIDPLGKPIAIGRRSCIVTGVSVDAPPNSHIKFSYILSSTSIQWFSQNHFNLRGALCYFKLRSGTDPRTLESKLPDMVDTYIAAEIERINRVTWKDYKEAGNGFRYFIRPISSIHLDPDISGGMKAGGNIVTLRILIAVAILVFVIACINFMNLSTARSMERAKEVGVRKVMGSFKTQLIFQFLTESLIISFASLVVAIGLTLLALPYFNILSDSSLYLAFNWINVIVFFSTAMFIALIAGIYPAFILSSFKPIKVLKGNFTGNTSGKWLKDGLVIFQFWISIILISSTWVLYKQIQFLSEKDLGYDTEELLVLKGAFHMDPNFTKSYLDEIREIPEVKEVAGTLWMPGFQGVWRDEYRFQESTEVHTFNRGAVGDRLLKTMGLELAMGKFFDPRTNDSTSVVLNERAVKVLNIIDPVGKKLIMLDHDEGQLVEIPFTIKGIVKDFNYGTLRTDIEPLVLLSNEKFFGRVSSIAIKIEGSNLKSTISQLEEKWKKLIPDRPFAFRFVDDVLHADYLREERLGTVFTLFSGLSIFISIIGLLALSIYSSELRKKEIGIRKVLGASINDLLKLLSKDFTKVICISILLATPVAWYLMDNWLTDFAYHIKLQWWIFPLTGLGTLVVTWLTVGIHTYQASKTNPIDSLKDE